MSNQEYGLFFSSTFATLHHAFNQDLTYLEEIINSVVIQNKKFVQYLEQLIQGHSILKNRTTFLKTSCQIIKQYYTNNFREMLITLNQIVNNISIMRKRQNQAISLAYRQYSFTCFHTSVFTQQINQQISKLRLLLTQEAKQSKVSQAAQLEERISAYTQKLQLVKQEQAQFQHRTILFFNSLLKEKNPQEVLKWPSKKRFGFLKNQEIDLNSIPNPTINPTFQRFQLLQKVKLFQQYYLNCEPNQ